MKRSVVFIHPESGKALGSTCACGVYTVGGGEEPCYNCRQNLDSLTQRVTVLEATLAKMLQADNDKLKADNKALQTKLTDIKRYMAKEEVQKQKSNDRIRALRKQVRELTVIKEDEECNYCHH